MVQLKNLKRLIRELSTLTYNYGNLSNSLTSYKDRAKIIVESIWPDSDYLSQIENLSSESAFDYVLKGDGFNERKTALINLLEVIVDDIEMNFQLTASNLSNDLVVSGQSKFDKVFIVHGHDDLAKTEVARFIEKLGFRPIILHEQVNSGMTIIEKIETYTDVGFGIVLYTPCDEGAKRGQEGELKPRARQNVILEHGYLMGKLKRNRVCALVKGDIELPTDISGIVYTEMDARKAWQIEVAKEMRGAGYPIDMNRL